MTYMTSNTSPDKNKPLIEFGQIKIEKDHTEKHKVERVFKLCSKCKTARETIASYCTKCGNKC